MDYDFSGYVTRNDLQCSDGRIIRRDAFKDCDGTVVPLVWQHSHDDPTNVLGHALLENRPDGVYGYGKFNNTERGQHSKKMVEDGDICAMSIFANRLKQQGNDVIHGVIREVSLVMAGANPGAFIDNIVIAHADGSYTDVEDEAVIYNNEESFDEVRHSNIDKEETMANSNKLDLGNLTDDQRTALTSLLSQYMDYQSEEIEHADDPDKTIEDVFNEFTDEQKNVVYFLIGQALEGEDVEHGDNEGEDFMKHNVFDETAEDTPALSHDELNAILADATRSSSLKEYLEDACLEHGITNLEVLFPEARMVRPTPDMITRDMGWVDVLWNGLHKSPFARIKSASADLTIDAARAKGYIKGEFKTEEQFALLSRETTPQTVYKKQKLDRDDVIDIVDIDVVAWLKAEMRMMLNEELCRAVLIGDGRDANSKDKIKPDRIRPIYQDADMYTIHYQVEYAADATNDDKSATLVDSAILAREDYRGSGNPKMFATNKVITQMLIARDKIGRRLYSNLTELASALRVSEIVEVPVMEGVTRTVTDGELAGTYDLLALIFNPADYTIGADKGGAVSLFDDFDIDYNQMKYLIETRCSGALTKPYSAIALEILSSSANPLSKLKVEPMPQSETPFDTAVSSIQTGVTVHDNVIGGTLHYLTEGSLPDVWGPGYFIALDLHDNTFTGLTSVKVGMQPSQGSGLQEIMSDPDKNGVFKVTDKFAQKFVVVQTDGTNRRVQKFDLSNLVFASE